MRSLPLIGLSGGIGLILASTVDLNRARTVEQKLDAGNDLAWGAQGLLYLSQSSPLLDKLTTGLGVVGAAMQTAVGVMRIRRGLAAGDQSLVKLGALDVGGGLLWLTWDLVGWEQPIFVGSYVLLMVGREAYANQDAVRRLAGRLAAEARRACDTLDRAQRDVEGILSRLDRRAEELRASAAAGGIAY